MPAPLRPFYPYKHPTDPAKDLNIPMGLCARRTVGKLRTGGEWVYRKHKICGRPSRSHYLINPTWDTSQAIIYRCRRGNGFYSSLAGHQYQDQYAYFIPSSINNPQGQAARTAFADAVHNWQNVLSEQVKCAFNKRAYGRHMGGYNLYIREYILSHV